CTDRAAGRYGCANQGRGAPAVPGNGALSDADGRIRRTADRLEAGLASQTVIHVRAVLRSALSQAERWLLVPRTVVKVTDPPRKKKPQLNVLTPTQTKIFVDACTQHRLRALYCGMFALGLRLGEALGVKWEDLDWDRGTVFIRRALQRVKRADNRTELQLVEPKSENSYRVLSIPASIRPVFKHHLGALSSCSRHPLASVELPRDHHGRVFQPKPHAAIANAAVSETTSHSSQRRRITVR